MKTNFGTVVIAAAAAALVLLAVDTAVVLRSAKQHRDDVRLVTHTQEVIAQLENLLSLAKDAENGQRGFLITGEDRYLEPYRQARDNIKALEGQVTQLTADNPLQQERMRAVRENVDERMRLLDEVLRLQRDQGPQAARTRLVDGTGKEAMDRLREAISSMVFEERLLLAERSARAERTYEATLKSVLVSGVVAVLAIAAFLFVMLRHLRARERAAAAIFEHREFLRTTVASIGDAVITTGVDGRVTYLNPVAEQLTGWELADAEGTPLTTVFNIVHEQTREPVPSPAERALREGVVVGLANHTILIARNGEERAIDDSAAPIRDAGNKVVGCVLVFRDVAERRAAEDAIKTSEQRFRQLADAMPQIVWAASADGAIEYYNRQWYEYSGAQPGALNNTAWHGALHPDDLPRWTDAYSTSIKAQTHYQIEARLKRSATGEYRWFLCRALPVRSADGKILRWFGTCTDIDDTKRMQEELQLGARRKDEFLAMLAHELRNPLAPIRNALAVMKTADDKAEAFERLSGIFERQLAQMVRLIDDLLDVSRISRSKLALRRERIDLAASIRDAVDAVRPSIDAAGHDFEVQLPAEPVHVDADPVRLAQVFSNLLNNAAKFTSGGGRITVKAERSGGLAVVTVRDTGIGIPAQFIGQIFEMFTQVGSASGHGGLGIGLALARSLVEMHTGTIEAKSEGAGKGSEFIVRLPALPGAMEGDAPVAPDSQSRARNLAPRRILVVDDNRDAAESLAMLLEITQSEVRVAHDGEEAIAVAEEFRPELILLDLGLPRLSGHDVARVIRKEPWGSSVHIVALTGWGQEGDRQRTRDAGFDHHLVKPVSEADLMAVVSSLGRGRQAAN